MTAELIVVLPSVLMVLAISIGSMAATLERARLVSVAAGVSRAVARAEPLDRVIGVYQNQLAGRRLEISRLGEMVCAEVATTVAIANLPGLDLRLAETQCARQIGL